MPNPQRFQGRERYLATSSGQTAFQLASGFFASDATTNAAQHRMYALDDARGFRLTFFGEGADNSTFDYRLWMVMPTIAFEDSPTDFCLEYFGGGTATLSTMVGASASTMITSSERVADTLTFTLATTATTPAGPATVFEATYILGDSDKYTGVANKTAYLVMPNFPASRLIVEFDLTGATAANCTIERTR